MKTIPTIGQIKALDGRIFAMLTPQESEVLDFYRAQGRKFDVAVSIINQADADELARPQAKVHEQAKLLLTMGGDLSLDYCPEFN